MRSIGSLRIAVLLILGLLLTACGGDSPTTDPPDSASNDKQTGSSDAADVTNPWALAWIATGDPETSFDTAETLTANGGEQPQTSERTLDSSGRFEWLYTQFVEAVEVTVTADGPLRFELVVARFVDPASNSAEIEIREVLETADIAAGGSSTLSAEKP